MRRLGGMRRPGGMRRLGVLCWLVVLVLTGTLAAGAGESNDDSEPPIVHLRVKGDRHVEVVLGPDDSANVIVYLHGVCGNPLAFRSWASAASAHATFISMRGDLECEKRKRRFKWSYNFKGLDQRIDRVIDAVEELRDEEAEPLDRGSVVLVGYSQGAHRVETMAHRYPKRYGRVVIIAPARAPDPFKLRKSERVLLIAGEKDAKKHIREGYEKLKKSGTAVKYLELPGARHGEYGPEAHRVMADGLEWLYK